MISIKGLRRKVWARQSELIRRTANGVCFCCGIKKEWKDCDASHYLHGDALDFEPDNIRCSCVRCNRFLHGNSGMFLHNLIKQLGYDPTDELIEKKHKTFKPTRDWLEHKLNELTLRVVSLEQGF